MTDSIVGWADGTVKPVEEITVPVTDRGFQFGDGLYETVLVREEDIPLFQFHVERLRDNCEELSLPFPGTDAIEEAIDHVLEAGMEDDTSEEPEKKQVLKLLLTAGSGKGGGRSEPVKTRFFVLPRNYPDRAREWQEEGVRGHLFQSMGNSGSQLATVKTLSRLGESLARERVVAETGDPLAEPFFVNEESVLLQGAITNIFLHLRGRWVTPKISSGVLPGVSRRVMLEYTPESGLREKTVFSSDLLRADHVLLTNAVVGPVSVREVIAPSLLHPSENPIKFSPVPSNAEPYRAWSAALDDEEIGRSRPRENC